MKNLTPFPSLFASLLALALVAGGCARGPISLRFGSDDPETKSGNGGLGGQKLEDLISWEEVSQKVLLNENAGRCNACHDQDEPPNLTTYNEYKLNLRAIKEEVVEKRSMPKRRKLTEEQLALVSLWIEQGAPEKGRPFIDSETPTTTTSTTTSSTTTTSSSTSTTTSSTTSTTLPPGPGEDELISWEEVSQKVFLNQATGRCNFCHDQDEAPNLTTYNEYKAELSSIFKEVVEDRSMPKRRKLTEEQIDLVRKWIEQGAPEKGRPFTP